MKHGKKYNDSRKLIDTLKLYDPEEVFVYESLEPNVPRVSAPLGFCGYNLNLRLESDDVITVSTTIKNNEDIRLSYSPSSPDEVIISDWVESETISAVGPFTLNIYPVGKLNSLGTQLIMRDTLTDREYYIDINTYKLDGTPVISAQLKLTVLDDPEYPYYEISGNKLYSLSEKRSRFLSIELVKYGFDDTALHDEFEKYDTLYN